MSPPTLKIMDENHLTSVDGSWFFLTCNLTFISALVNRTQYPPISTFKGTYVPIQVCACVCVYIVTACVRVCAL